MTEDTYPQTFDGLVVLVTGAGSGIGRASALAFARRGATVALLDVDDATLAKTDELISAMSGTQTMQLTVDVSDPDQAEGIVPAVLDRFGRLDAAHNNAGIPGPYVPLAAYEEADFARVLAVDLFGVWRCMKAEISHMRASGGGAIVNTSSMLGLVGMQDNSAYTAAKHAVHGLTKCAALENADHGIRVNAVAPGVTRTGMTSSVSDDLLRAVPMGRIAEPDEIAGAVAWLCSEEASYVTGSILVVDGGYLA
jgi:NAD(P)-dependent dehydrogenase (short-subunit alcohol dehydrogenase family)